ncbi:hypothetical protein VTL71DRAFT_201 [Oculimacula yallundae]|uniref:Uncharacterized protein n=1 Tax=Oculimacula yallundae TaxID=86028 RepID=A0ABR4CZA9_9HELO
MCIGRIDLHSCGCFDDLKIFPCRMPFSDGTPDNCDGIGAMITNHINHFCSECAERKKMNAARLASIVAESREGKIELFETMGDGADMVGVAEGVRGGGGDGVEMGNLSGSGGKVDVVPALYHQGEDDAKKKGGIENVVGEGSKVSTGGTIGEDRERQSKARSMMKNKHFQEDEFRPSVILSSTNTTTAQAVKMCIEELSVYGCGCVGELKKVRCGRDQATHLYCLRSNAIREINHPNTQCESCVEVAAQKAAKHIQIIADFKYKNPGAEVLKFFSDASKPNSTSNTSGNNTKSSVSTSTRAPIDNNKKAAAAIVLATAVRSAFHNHETSQAQQHTRSYTTLHSFFRTGFIDPQIHDRVLGLLNDGHGWAKDDGSRLKVEIIKACDDVLALL